jgi:hypothetical protein
MAARAPSPRTAKSSPAPRAPRVAAAPEAPARTATTLHLSRELVEECRDAVVHLAGPPRHLTLTALVELALEHELARLRRAHTAGKRFPRRKRELRAGRPIGS